MMEQQIRWFAAPPPFLKKFSRFSINGKKLSKIALFYTHTHTPTRSHRNIHTMLFSFVNQNKLSILSTV